MSLRHQQDTRLKVDNGRRQRRGQIQTEAIPHALEGKDLIGLAQTGSGKTGAFALPVLQALLETPHAFFACVLSPTRELAIQIAEQFEALGSGIGIKCAVLVGGVDYVQQGIALGKRPHIVVATPGRLVDHLSNTKGFSLRTLKYLVLDEADRLLNEDFEKAIDEILNVIPRERKTYLFSATMTNKVRKLQRACLRNPVKIEAASKYSTVDTLKQQYRFIAAKHKDCYLVYILTEMSGSTSMVFTRTCDSTRILALILRNLGLRAIPISGQMSQAKRLGALNKFKAGECNILICTDVASRGLDIPSVDMVINYDIPTNSKDYIHRVGRTARAGRSGVAISLVNQYELEWYIQIEKLIGKKLPEFPAQEEEVLLLLERVTEAKRISQMKIKETGGKKKRNWGGDDDECICNEYVEMDQYDKEKRSEIEGQTPAGVRILPLVVHLMPTNAHLFHKGPAQLNVIVNFANYFQLLLELQRTAMMPFNDDSMKTDSGSLPDFGAIFMSNRTTMGECFKRKLFGLPSSFAEFVKKVKTGMVLFLFEYEQRKLYGVFQAVSDGSMNIVPHAYHSSGKQFSAQVRFRVIWNCHPISEHDFCDAIRDNYFAANKFNFGLSKDQVHRLLWLFSSRKVRVQKSLKRKKVEERIHKSSDKANPLVDSGKLGLEKYNSRVKTQPRLSSRVFCSLDASISNFLHPMVSGTSNCFTSVHEFAAPVNLSVSGGQSFPLQKEREDIDVSSYSASSDLGDYIPLSSFEDSDPSEIGNLSAEDIDHSSAASRPHRGRCNGNYQSNPINLTGNYTGVKRLYSDRNKRTSVFSRLNLVSKAAVQEESEDNSEVYEIMQDLQQRHRHGNWKKTPRKSKGKALENRDNARASVFSRLNFASKGSVPDKEVNTRVVKSKNIITEKFQGKKKMRA
ncbi:hypothetical protein F0562_008582 [Nyssa sinensis]|uniref:RNA helicase n=1 Tax=Nyssa sinensis TaxID=561372 RepID=A0A5J5AA67_9ASTE|nr:hypothetical protein F0562_008582 [Nyssa sinensis]